MKKTLAMLLAGAMCLSLLAGCGSKEEPAAPGADGPSAPAADAFQIGGVGPLTGGAAIYGNAAKNGAEIAMEEINAKGGIQVNVKYEDDAHAAEKSVNA